MPKIDPVSSPSYSKKRTERELERKARAIYHVLAPRKIHSSTLEGWNTGAALSQMISMLESYKKDHSTPYNLKHLDRVVCHLIHASAIQNLFDSRLDEDQWDEYIISEMMCMKIADLKEGECVVFPGGYKGTSEKMPGHAILYEVIAEPNQKFTFLINNTGAGIGHHKTNITSKRTHQLEYRKLDLKDLDADFWSSLCKLRNQSRNSNEIYAFIDKKLNKHDGNKVSGRRIKFQRSGVCAWKSISTWAHGKIAPGLTATQRRPHEEIIYHQCKKNLIEKKIQELKDPLLKNYIKEHMDAYKKTFISTYIEKIALFLKKFFKIEYKPHRYYQGDQLVELLNRELHQKKKCLEKKIRTLEQKV